MSTVAAVPPKEVVDYVRKCLEEGFTQEQTAQSLGVSASYVSQLCAQHQIVVHADAAFEEIDSLYAKIEKTALDNLTRVIATIHDPIKLLNIATRINATKRRSIPTTVSVGSQQVQAGKGVVKLSLPQVIAGRFIMNSSNQAIGWVGREDAEGSPTALEAPKINTLVTASNGQLKDIAARYAQKAAQEAKPPASSHVADEDM